MAQDDRQSQAHQLAGKTHIGEINIQFSKLSFVTQYQQTQAMQFVQCKARRIGIVQNIRTVFVRIGVGYLRTNLV